jgi:hypothetical protein
MIIPTQLYVVDTLTPTLILLKQLRDQVHLCIQSTLNHWTTCFSV